MSEKLLKYFFDLVQIPSPSGGEQAVANYLQNWLKSNNFSISIDELGQIIAFRKGIGVPVLFCAHMDTVKTKCRNIRPVVKDGIIKSKGMTILGADNKAAIAAIMVGTENYLASTEKPRSIEILFSVKEETGGGVELMQFENLQSTQAIIFDLVKPIGSICCAAPYIYNFDIAFIGKEVHASTPNYGLNPTTMLSYFLSRLPMGFHDNKKTLVNIGPIKSNKDRNSVPERVEIFGEVRSFDEKLFYNKIEQIKRLAEKAAESVQCSAQIGKAEIKLSGYCKGYNLDRSLDIFKKIEKVYKKVGVKAYYVRSGGISDANPLIEAGITTVTLGDGITGAHTVLEQIAQKDLEKMAEIVNFLLIHL